jgi:Tol biopolymer transport system component
MVPGDTNGVVDVFVRDRVLATTTLLSTGVGGVPADGPTDVTGISSDARYVALVSLASNLVPNDTNGQFDSFVLDRASGVIERVSVSSTGQEASGSSWSCAISEDGRFAVFTDTAPDVVPNDTNSKRDVFRRDRVAQTTTRISISLFGAQADSDCVHPAISGDGTVTAFTTAASTMVFTDTNGVNDVFVESCKPAQMSCFGTAATCPCGNVGDANAGCASSSLPGARLYALGGPFVSNDTLTLVAMNVPPGSLTAFLEGSGPTSPPSGFTFGDGLLCLAAPFQIRALRPATSNAARFGYLPGEPLLSVVSAVPAGGDVRYYQAWYRSAENFCTSATFNLSNAATVQWYP